MTDLLPPALCEGFDGEVETVEWGSLDHIQQFREATIRRGQVLGPAIVCWDSKAGAFVPGVAEFKPRRKSRFVWYKRARGFSWRPYRVGGTSAESEYRAWLAARDAAAETKLVA